MQDYNIVRCDSCSSIFADIAPDTKDHFVNYSKMNNSPLHVKPRQIVARTYIDYLKSKLPLDKIDNALDIGCAEGYFVRELQNNKVRTTGIEANHALVENAVCPGIIQGFFDEKYDSGSMRYDLVSFTQNMYYFRDNLKVVQKAKALLNNGGFIFIATVNGDDPRIVHYFSNLGTVFSIQCIATRRAYELMCQKVGLQIVDYTTYEPEILLDMIENKLKFLKHVLLSSKNAYHPSESGYHAFILLKAA